MMTNDKLDTGKVFLQNLKYLKLIPYTDGGDTLGTTAYSFDSLLADSVSLQQDDPTTTRRDCETKDEPVLQSTVLGSYQFAATSVDMQPKILENFMGWIKGGGSDTDVYYAPVAYKASYCLVVLAFKDTDKTIVIPKLKLNSKVVLASLKTSSGQIDLAGTAYAGKLTVGSTSIETPVAYVPFEKLNTVIEGYTE